MTDVVAPTPAPADSPTPRPAVATCEVCGRGPAIHIDARMYTGKVVVTDEVWWKGYACRECATCQYRAGLTHCLWAGWWSPVAFFVNPTRIWRNVRGLREVAAMPAPVGEPRAEPLDAGRPVSRRPQAWVGLIAPLVIVGALVGLLVAATGGRSLAEVAHGECLDLPEGPVIDSFESVDCAGPHDAEVTGTIGPGDAGPADRLCVEQTISYLGTDEAVDGIRAAAIRLGTDDDAEVVCVVMSSAKGGELTGSHRNTER